MPATSGRQAARTRAARDSIVQAALTVFALKGFAAASMDDVCLAAGCSKGGLYHHFPTKSAVLSAVVDRLSTEGSLMPPFRIPAVGPAVPADALGRIVIEVWAEAARNESLRAQVIAGYEAALQRTNGDGGRLSPLSELLSIGALVQTLTRSELMDPSGAARRLGIERAA